MKFRLLFSALLLTAIPVAVQPAAAQPASVASAPAAPAADAEAADAENVWYLDLSSGGRVTIRLRPDLAPQHVERIRELTRQGFYDGLVFHRVIDGFMAQGGDPTATGQGGSPLPNLKAEFNDAPHMRGTVAMARANSPDSANSQFFIMFQPMFRLDHNYTAFGRVTGGMQWVDAIARGEPPANPTRILQASIAADHKPPPDFAAAESAVAPPAEDPVAAALAKLGQPEESGDEPAAPQPGN